MGVLSPLEAAAEAGDFSPFSPKQPQFPAKAKRVLHIFAAGAPSHLDTWDPKPELAKYDEKPMPDDSNGTVFASPFKFKLFGN